jgi:hypothetical protein
MYSRENSPIRSKIFFIWHLSRSAQPYREAMGALANTAANKIVHDGTTKTAEMRASYD